MWETTSNFTPAPRHHLTGRDLTAVLNRSAINTADFLVENSRQMNGFQPVPRKRSNDYSKAILRVLVLLWLALQFATPVLSQVYTKSYDAARTSENRSETQLTPAAVDKGLTMLPRIPCIGDQIGCEAQPLIDENTVWTEVTRCTQGSSPMVVPCYPGTRVGQGSPIMVLASEANVIRGVVPIGGAALWQTQPLCVPVTLSNLTGYTGPSPDMWGTNDHAGMMGTGVIDPDTHVLYQMATCSKDGSGSVASMQQVVFALDDRTGRVLNSTVITGSSNGQNYGDAPRKQRAALGLWNRDGVKFVEMCAGSYSESGPTATGWLVMIDTFDLGVKAAQAFRAGCWGSGQGPANGSDGSIYIGLGNGSFNGVTDFGEAALKLQFTPPTSNTTAQLSLVGNFTPFLDSQRMCATAALTTPTQQLKASTGAAPGAHMPMASVAACDAAKGDQDAFLTWTLVERFGQLIGAGKDGIGYVIPIVNFPRTQPADFSTVATRQANCNRVAMYEFAWDFGISPCMVNPSGFPLLFPDDPTQPISAGNPGRTRHQHAPMPQYTAPDGTFYLFASGENSWVNVWKADSQGRYTWVARTDVRASAQVSNGMPGAFCSVSDNAGANAILWCSVPDGDANRTRTTGSLYAFDLTQLGQSGAQAKLPVLWHSATYAFSKFSQPIVYSGTVILADGAGSVMEWRIGGVQ